MSQQRHSCCRTLEGSILTFKFLNTLVVSHNRLAGLDQVLKCLKKLPFLKHLGKRNLHILVHSQFCIADHFAELHDNPCAQELGYRARILAAMPHLEILDRHVVTSQELEAAKASHGRRKPRAQGSTSKPQTLRQTQPSTHNQTSSPMRSSKASQLLSSTQRAQRHSSSAAGGGGSSGASGSSGAAPPAATKITQLLDSEARRVRRQQRLAQIKAAQELFQAGSSASRTMAALGEAVPPSALTTTLQEGEVGVAAAGVAAAMQSRGVLPHETSAMAKAGWGVVTAANQGALTSSLEDLQQRGQLLQGSEGTAELEFKPASTAASVRAFRPGSTLSASATGAMGGAKLSSMGGGTFVPKLGSAGSAQEGTLVRGMSSDTPAVGLGPWEVYHVRRMFEAADVNGDGVLSQAELGAILGRAEEYGVALDGPEAAAAVQDVVQQLMQTADADGDGRLDWREFLRMVASGSGGVKFRCLSATEARSKSEALFAKAGRLQKRILRSAAGDARVAAWQGQALALAERGGRLAELAARLEGKYDPPEAPPTPPPKRNDHYQTSALVPVRQAAKTRQRGMRHYTVPPPGQESDSDSDEGLPGAVRADKDYAQYRARRKNRKPHTVMTKTTFL